MGNYCVHRFKQPPIFSPEEAEKAYAAYEKRMKEMSTFPVKKVKDKSSLGAFTIYEEQLNIRNVHLEDFENRLKQFVYKNTDKIDRASQPAEPCTIKLKQLKIAFAGNQYLEAMLNDKTSLDWRILMWDNIFIDIQDEEDHYREEESAEEDPELAFRVDELNLFGLLYCKCEPEVRVERFYSFLQPGLEEQISCEDRDLEVFVPLMGRICYEAVINCYNAEQIKKSTGQMQPDLIPDNDKLYMLDEACKQVLADEDIGFLEKLFGYQTRISASLFNQSMLKDNFSFLQPHTTRIMVQQHLTEIQAEQRDAY